MEKVRFCEACGKALILDKEHHKVVRNVTAVGLAVGFGRNQEPQFWDAFDCEYCGCQTIIGERKREVLGVKFEDTEEDIKVESEPQDGQISSPDDGKDFGPDCEGNCYPCNGCINDDYSDIDDDLADIKKKIEEAGE